MSKYFRHDAKHTVRHRTVESLIASRLRDIRESFARCLRKAREIHTQNPTISKAQAEQDARQAIESILSLAVSAETQLQHLIKQRIRYFRDYRKFKWEYKIDRDATIPDVAMTLSVLTPCLFAEGGIAGAMMALDGKMGLTSGLAYGLIFAALNISLAALAGFMFVRYLNFRVHAEYPEPKDRWVRGLARGGLTLSIALLILLIFAAARTRAIGTHAGIFDFSQVSFLQTFDDSITLLIVALGMMGTVLGLYEGANGFSDPEPGFTKARKQAEEEIDSAGMALSEEAIEQIEERCEDASADYEDYLAEVRDEADRLNGQFATVTECWIAHNNFVRNSKDEVRLFEHDRAQIEGKLPRALDLEAFDKLLLPLEKLAHLERTPIEHDEQPSSSVLSRLAMERDQAISRVRAAHLGFLSCSLEDLELSTTPANETTGLNYET